MATPLRSGDVLGLGAATVTFFEETLSEAGEPGGNGFSRASRALARALDGLPASEQELLRQLAELEESLEKAPLAAASLKMSAGDFRAAAEVLSVAQAGLGSNFQLGLHLGICLAKTEQFEDADRVLERVFLDAPDHATKQQALDLRRQALLARQQKLCRKQLEQAVQHLQGERFLDTSAIFEQLPPDLKNEPSVKLMAAIARVKLILSVPVQPGGRGVLALHLSNTLGDVEDVISRAQDAFTRSQAMGLKSQLQTLLRQLS
ncbi:MAG: tetratricopeptide repeat protein [Holophagales bacterium]|nr:tetratricopeptide repeat protein [Holophagales bacterium]